MFERNKEKLPEVHHLFKRELSEKLTMAERRRIRKRLFIIQQQQQQQQERKFSKIRESHTMHKCQLEPEMKETREQFIKMETKSKSRLIMIDSINNKKKIEINTKTVTAFLISLCLAIVCHQAWGRQLSSQEASDIKANMPTVIVRGFLNYRTTVDGTVLLFTPDAGGSSSAVGLQPASSNFLVPAPPTTTMLFQQSIQSSLALPAEQIEPTSSFQPPVATKAPFESAAGDVWRPVVATPPLHQQQQTLEVANQFRQPVGASSSFSSYQDHDTSRALSFGPEVGAPAVGDSLAVGSQAGNQPQRSESSSTPSVQSDDVINVNDQASSPKSTISSVAQPTSELAPRTSRPRRPSLGFNGQEIRAGGRRSDGRPRVQTGNQNEAQTHNTINGIRRPGISTTPMPVSSSEEQQQQQQPVTNPPPSRSSVAGAKLRNRFKRPPTSGQPASSTTASSFIQAITPAVSPQPLVPNSSVSSSSSALTLQSTSVDSSDQIVDGSLSVSPSTPAAVATVEVAAETAPIIPQQADQIVKPEGGSQAELRIGDQAALQARLGDLFGHSPLSSSTSATGNNPLVANSPSVGSDEVLLAPSDGGQALPDDRKLISRSGDQPPSPDIQHDSHVLSGGLSGGELQQGQLGNAPLSLDALFQGDQPQPESSEHRVHHHQGAKSESSSIGGSIAASKKNHNERLTGWLDHHHSNKHIPRPAKHHDHEAGHLSQQLAANLNSLSPSFASNLPSQNSLKPTSVQAQAHLPTSALHPEQQQQDLASNSTTLARNNNGTMNGNETSPLMESLQMQTLTQSYSTVMTTTRTRLVPLQVKSSTAVHTITENYVITKVLTAYQTMPVGEFILPEVHSTRSPFEMFGETPVAPSSEDKSRNGGEQPISAPSNFVAPATVQSPSQQAEMQEQPISFEPKSPDWLNDFNNNQQQQQLQQNHLVALLEQQAQEQNLAGFGLGSEPLDQLASSLDPASIINNGQIQLPDLNNPIVLAAAIQNPQLAAVILAAQQLQLKQRANKLQGGASGQQNGQNNQAALLNPAVIPLQPSYSTAFSTQVRPSTYTVRDTMFTTRLVSFKDGRTVRTRTVSEPGSVIEQVLTTTVTETIPYTLTIRPTGMLTLPASGQLATAAPQQNTAAGSGQSNQATINNALIATQLAQLLSRRQQQVQPSGLAALQQLIASQQQQLQSNNNQNNRASNQQQQQVRQFQPNFQNLLQSLQQQQQQQQQASNQSPQTSQNSSPEQQQSSQPKSGDKLSVQPTPPLAPLPTQPYVTTITNLQVKTYTVHNAFQTHFRTITSTQLITSTIFPAGMTRSPTIG